MTYGRMRTRNGLGWRPDDDRQSYPGPGHPEAERRGNWWHVLVGDLNRMERDYVDGRSDVAGSGPDPAEETAQATGVDVETVRAVLRHVFRESR